MPWFRAMLYFWDLRRLMQIYYFPCSGGYGTLDPGAGGLRNIKSWGLRFFEGATFIQSLEVTAVLNTFLLHIRPKMFSVGPCGQLKTLKNIFVRAMRTAKKRSKIFSVGPCGPVF